MWGFWSRDPTKDFGYELGDVIGGLEDKSIWAHHQGKRKATGEAVSIFKVEMRPGHDNYIEKAKAAVKRLKTLRHPSILTYVDSLETDKVICVVTEYVEPLEMYLSRISNYTTEQKQFAISWGLHQISKGLSFMINDCNLNHNNILAGSVYVSQSGSWRIGGLEYVSSTSDDSVPQKLLASLSKYDSPDSNSMNRKGMPNKWANDSWGLGILIWETFNGPLTQSTSLKSVGKIPKTLSAIYMELINVNPSKRISPSDFITKCRKPSGFFKNNFIDAMLFLEEIQIKEPSEKNRFFTNLDSHLDSFPHDACRNKILPQLITAFEYSNAGSAILGPLFKIGKLLEEEEYQKKIVPCIVKLFASKDRATRAKLLQQMEVFINYLNSNIVNDQIFPHIAQGFIDSNPTIREQTVKCMLFLAPKLSYTNLNEEVLKHFARLQARDEEGGIRTNTTVCMGKIAGHLHPQIRQTVLIPAFLRSMRDPFPAARISGILSLVATQSYYSLRDSSTKVMPALCHLTMDPDKSVRDQSFKALKNFVSKLEKVSEDPSLAEQMEADLNAAGSSTSSNIASSWAGWAVSSFASKFYRSKTPTTNTVSAAKMDKASDDSKGKDSPTASTKIKQPSEGSDDEDWGSMDVNAAAISNDGNVEDKKPLDGWENDDEWKDNDEEEEIKDEPVKSESDLFFDELTTQSGKNVSKQQSGDKYGRDEEKLTEEKREKRNPTVVKSSQPARDTTTERKLKNRRQNAGPMKLGAKRVT